MSSPWSTHFLTFDQPDKQTRTMLSQYVAEIKKKAAAGFFGDLPTANEDVKMCMWGTGSKVAREASLNTLLDIKKGIRAAVGYCVDRRSDVTLTVCLRPNVILPYPLELGEIEGITSAYYSHSQQLEFEVAFGNKLTVNFVGGAQQPDKSVIGDDVKAVYESMAPEEPQSTKPKTRLSKKKITIDNVLDFEPSMTEKERKEYAFMIAEAELKKELEENRKRRGDDSDSDEDYVQGMSQLMRNEPVDALLRRGEDHHCGL